MMSSESYLLDEDEDINARSGDESRMLTQKKNFTRSNNED